MKNQVLITFVSLSMLFLMASCDEEWLGEVKPQGSLSEANFYQNEEHAIRAITSCYDPLKHPRTFNQNYYFYFDSFSDQSIHEQNNMNNMIINTSDEAVYGFWIQHYLGIYRANIAIEKIAGLYGEPGIEMDEELKARLIAEAKFIRGLNYYYLVKIFGNPALVERTEEDLDVELTNATDEELFSFMETDFLDAIEVLPEIYESSSDLGRATKGAARAYLGKMYLLYNEFGKAREQFLAIRQSGVYQLMMPLGPDSADYTAAFRCNFTGDDITTRTGNTYDSENNSESVFEIQFETGGWETWEGGWQADGHMRTRYYGPDGFKNMVPTLEYVNQFEEAQEDHPAGVQYDPRKYVSLYQPGDSIYYVQDIQPVKIWRDRINTNPLITQGFGWGKHFKPTFWSESSDPLNNDYNNIRLVRYSEVLLALAEAEYMVNGSTTLAVECVNEVRGRAGMPGVDEVTPEVIIHERNIEFGFETKRYWDLVRWSKYDNPWVDITELMPSYIPARQGLMPIPIFEINLSNGKLQQNPGY